MSEKSQKRKFEFASPSIEGEINPTGSQVQIDWAKCMFCQKGKTEKLVDPNACEKTLVKF